MFPFKNDLSQIREPNLKTRISQQIFIFFSIINYCSKILTAKNGLKKYFNYIQVRKRIGISLPIVI